MSINTINFMPTNIVPSPAEASCSNTTVIEGEQTKPITCKQSSNKINSREQQLLDRMDTALTRAEFYKANEELVKLSATTLTFFCEAKEKYENQLERDKLSHIITAEDKKIYASTEEIRSKIKSLNEQARLLVLIQQSLLEEDPSKQQELELQLETEQDNYNHLAPGKIP